MKKILAMALATIMLSLCAIPCFAVKGEVHDPIDLKFGSPDVDGILDEMYRDGFILEINDKLPFYQIGGGTTETLSAKAYYLWDYSYVYYCVVVKDNNIVTRGETFHELEESFEEDCVEQWFVDGGDFKVNTDAYGYSFFTGDGICTFDPDEAHYKTSVDLENNTYVVEVAVPLPDLDEGREFGLGIQVNSIDDEEAKNGGAYQDGGVLNDGMRTYVKCVLDKAQGATSGDGSGVGADDTTTDAGETTIPDETTDPADETTKKPDETTKKPDETTKKPADTTAAATTAAPEEKSGCGSVVGMTALALVAMVAVPAVAFSKKK